MKAAVLAILLGVVYSATWEDEVTYKDIAKMNTFEEFQKWKLAFDRAYSSMTEEAQKYEVWLDNLETIAYSNSKNLTYKLRLNQFGDMTGDEFRVYVHGKDGSCFKRSEIDINVGVSEKIKVPVNAPAAVAWQDKGVVTPVKNQGQCGSCWAFSATGALECDYAIKTGDLNSLSEQQLVDCAGAKYGCYGCNGGQMTGALEYAAHNGGLCSEKEYPYTARDGSCKATTCGTKYDASKGYTPVQRDSEPAMVTAGAAGCVSIGIEADQTAFQHYSSGVLSGECGTRIDHGVLLTGYGTATPGGDYWWVKNSWGTSWGEKGYCQMCRNCNKNHGAGECGILTEGNVPTF